MLMSMVWPKKFAKVTSIGQLDGTWSLASPKATVLRSLRVSKALES